MNRLFVLRCYICGHIELSQDGTNMNCPNRHSLYDSGTPMQVLGHLTLDD